MRLLNLHCHSIHSDGSDSIEVLASAFKNNSHLALILTDHDYLLTTDKWEAEVKEAKIVSKKLNYPIIVGLEAYIQTVGEEVLIFGYEACRSWLLWRDIHKKKAPQLFLEWYEIQKEREDYHPFALILAHPRLMHDHRLYKLLDGYEISNGGIYWGDFYVAKMQEYMPHAAPYHGIDLHELSELDQRCNIIDDQDLMIEDEKDLITYLKSKVS